MKKTYITPATNIEEMTGNADVMVITMSGKLPDDFAQDNGETGDGKDMAVKGSNIWQNEW